jgi:hypothetical protein
MIFNCNQIYLLAFPSFNFLPVSVVLDQTTTDKMATTAVAQTHNIIASIVEDLVSHACGECKEHGQYPIAEKKTKKRVCFAEDTKTHDGPEFAKQVAELIVYACFEKLQISCDKSIIILLNGQYGCGYIDRKVADRVMKLLTNVYDKLQFIPPYNRKTTVPLFRNTNGKYGLKFGKQHQPYLGQLIRLCKASFRDIN